ncbi:bifunctional adenosylcobinamide kinase/adenosylcobinamide-phosphate guanylyltransferase [bacterium]|nr:MAG: bifunctional adenosylcobinamide kinase/adenosylcobinamide-phosphate guanylyltransferase [bacterium]
MKKFVLVLGGARSGKSEFAEKLAASIGGGVVFVATGSPVDEKLRLRIQRNRARRPQAWRTLEVGTSIGRALAKDVPAEPVVLLDSLSGAIANVVLRARSREKLAERADPDVEQKVDAEVAGLLNWYARNERTLIVVSDELSMGATNALPSVGAYAELNGQTNRRLAEVADEVFLMIAGIPLNLKESPKGLL